MKPLKPGQFCTINNTLYRAKKRTLGCNGCAFNNPFTCPNIRDSRADIAKQQSGLDCTTYNVIFVRN
jgi:hypothetical protein